MAPWGHKITLSVYVEGSAQEGISPVGDLQKVFEYIGDATGADFIGCEVEPQWDEPQDPAGS